MSQYNGNRHEHFSKVFTVKENRVKLIRLFEEGKLNNVDIAAVFGVHASSIHHRRKQYGFTNPKQKPLKSFSCRKEIIRLFKERRMTNTEIATVLGISYSVISRLRKELGFKSPYRDRRKYLKMFPQTLEKIMAKRELDKPITYADILREEIRKAYVRGEKPDAAYLVARNSLPLRIREEIPIQ